jgi:hypothetical protein
LIESASLAPLIVAWDGGGTIHDPRRHCLPATHRGSSPNGKSDASLPKVTELIKSEVGKSKQPVSCGRLATQIVGLDSTLATDWGGKGTFRKFVESLNVKPVEFNWTGSGGVAYDPGRHSPENGASAADIGEDWADKDLLKVAKQIHQLTGVPLLSPDEYRNLLEMIAEDVASAPFHLMETGKRARDRCRDSGLPVSRADVNDILRGLLMRGHSFEEGPNDALTLRRKLADNIRSLCLREQIVLDTATDGAIQAWIVGK